MRLGKMYEILEQEKPKLKLEYSQASNGNFQISNFNDLRQSLSRVSAIKALSKHSNHILGQIPYTNQGEKVSWTNAVFQKLNSDFNVFLNRVNLLFETLNDSVEKPEPGTVYLKLPQFKNLQTLSEEIDLLEGTFNQIFGAVDNKVNVELRGFDTGTPWLVFVVGASAVTFFASTLIAAMRVAQETMKTKMIYNQFESSNNDAEHKRKIDEAMSILIDNIVNGEAQKLISKYHNNPEKKDGDELIRVAVALKKLSTLFTSGGDVQVPQITQGLIAQEKQVDDLEGFNFEEVSMKLENGQKEILKISQNEV